MVAQHLNDHEDDIPTDVSSSRDTSVDYPTSTPTKQIRNEADKQILEWAAKLELESMELRERSTALLQNLNEKYINLNTAVNKFDNIEKSSFVHYTNTLFPFFLLLNH